MSTEVEATWLIRGTLAHVTMRVRGESRSYKIAWLMGPDGEVCDNEHALLGDNCYFGDDGLVYPNAAPIAYDEALALARKWFAEAVRDQRME